MKRMYRYYQLTQSMILYSIFPKASNPIGIRRKLSESLVSDVGKCRNLTIPTGYRTTPTLSDIQQLPVGIRYQGFRRIRIGSDNSSDWIRQSDYSSWIGSKKRFTIVKINDQSVLYSAKKKSPIVKHENLFEIIYQCYQTAGHLGRNKTWSQSKPPSDRFVFLHMFWRFRLKAGMLRYHSIIIHFKVKWLHFSWF